jgi:phage terminase small subunit
MKKRKVKRKAGKAALNKRQKAFVEQFIRLGNATTAAIAAGYSKKGADVAGARLLGNAGVRAEVDRRKVVIEAKMELTTDRTLREVARLSYSDNRKLYNEDGLLKLPHEWDDDSAATVAGVEILEEFDGTGRDRRLIGYTKKLKVWDKNAALEKAMKFHGLYERDNDQAANAVARIVRKFIVPAKKHARA